MSNADTQRGAILAIHGLNAVAALRLAAVARASYAAAVARRWRWRARARRRVLRRRAVVVAASTERAAGVAWLVQGNYAGWALGPRRRRRSSSTAVVRAFMFLQALACVDGAGRAAPLTWERGDDGNLLEGGRSRGRRSGRQSRTWRGGRAGGGGAVYAVAAGVGFVPAVVDDIWGRMRRGAARVARVGVVFIQAGVACGTALGRFRARNAGVAARRATRGGPCLGGLHAGDGRPSSGPTPSAARRSRARRRSASSAPLAEQASAGGVAVAGAWGGGSRSRRRRDAGRGAPERVRRSVCAAWLPCCWRGRCFAYG